MNITLKPITPTDVCLAATTLILAEGRTTTLIVQQFLRNRGYQTRQAEVSKWLLTTALTLGWGIDSNGIFLIYSFPTPGASAQ